MTTVYNFDHEDQARSAALRRWGIDTERRPSGSRPDGADDGISGPYPDYEHGPIVDTRDIDQATLDAAADHRFVYFTLNASGDLTETSNKALKARCAEIEAKNEAALADLRKEVAELRVSLARLEGAASERARPAIIRP